MAVPLVAYGAYESKVVGSSFRFSWRERAGTSAPDCFYCKSPMLLVSDKRESFNASSDPCYYDAGDLAKDVFECGQCGWWAFHGSVSTRCTGGDGAEPNSRSYERILCGVAQAYDIGEESVPLDLLRCWLQKHPEHLAHLNPHAFERLMADCFKDCYPAAEVVHLGRHSKDGGVDIKLVMTDESSVLVQVKRRSDLTRSEGVSAVRQLNGVLLHEGVARGIVVTTAKQFTDYARQESMPRTPPLDRYRVDLLAFDDVVNLLKLGRAAEKPAWHSFLDLMTVPIDDSELDDELRKEPGVVRVSRNDLFAVRYGGP
jgi:hypothetical protein